MLVKAPVPLLAALEIAFNRYLRLDPEAPQRMGALVGNVIAIEIQGPDIAVYLIPGTDGVQVLGAYEGAADTCLSGTPLALARLGAQGGPDSLFAGEVMISGDVELGAAFQHVLGSIDIDWEEQFAHVVGDVVAHQAGRAARGLRGWGAQVLDTLERDLAEYLHEETRDLPTRREVESFLSEVDTLRADADRLEARVKRLQDMLKNEE
jgi:ubiquinone biosynthesis protein UbiJ